MGRRCPGWAVGMGSQWSSHAMGRRWVLSLTHCLVNGEDSGARCFRGDTTGIPRAASRCITLHHVRITCITREPPASRCITCIKPASPASNLHHPHHTLHHAQNAASTLHQPCISRAWAASRALGKPKHQARYAKQPLRPAPRARRGAQPARTRTRARARARASADTANSQRARARASADAADSQKARARADSPRAAWTAPRVTSPHRARRASYARSWARAPPARGGGRGRMARGLESPVERKQFEKKREQ